MRRKDRKTWILALLLCLLAAIFSCCRNAETEQNTVLQEAVLQEEVSSGASQSTCIGSPGSIPDYGGEDCVVLNGGIPNFTQAELEFSELESYSELDSLGRCGTAFALLHRSMEPSGQRDRITDIHPTGWIQKKYKGLIDTDPPYLYNRCHLIAYAMTGQNANEKNLITGTRHMNAELMQEWEVKVLEYLDESGNHVLYRVTPFFAGDEKLARGVEMEAFSVEDEGRGVCFHVFVYNVQPGVEIDYATGNNWLRQ